VLQPLLQLQLLPQVGQRRGAHRCCCCGGGGGC